jgi:hypothetical protein
MRTARSALPAFLSLALLGVPALSLAAPLAAANGEAAGCPDPVAGDVDADGVPPQKPAAAKRGAPRDAGKPRQATPYRSGDTPSRSAPRWHRFLPGMYR